MKDYHDSDCATHNEPAFPNGPCDCRLSLPVIHGFCRDCKHSEKMGDYEVYQCQIFDNDSCFDLRSTDGPCGKEGKYFQYFGER